MQIPIDGVVEGLKQVFGPEFGMSPYFRQPIFFQRYFEDGLPRTSELIRQTVKGYFSDAAEVSVSCVGPELLRVNVVTRTGERYIVTAHRLSVGEAEVWSFTIFDDSPLSDFLAGLFKRPKTVGAWRPYLLEHISGANQPLHPNPGTIDIRFRINLELDTDLAVWVHFDEASKQASFGADWLSSSESGGWAQIAGKIDRLLEESKRLSGM